MRLKDLCDVKTDFPDADFWITRKGDINSVGKPTKEFDPEKIGVKVVRTDLLLPDYLYYVFEFLVMKGAFASMGRGTSNLKNITIDDVKNIPIGQQD
jgi:restriction endonuclease S subunit